LNKKAIRYDHDDKLNYEEFSGKRISECYRTPEEFKIIFDDGSYLMFELNHIGTNNIRKPHLVLFCDGPKQQKRFLA
jgi:hypothetical protein